jgi:hypothetical protein
MTKLANWFLPFSKLLRKVMKFKWFKKYQKLFEKMKWYLEKPYMLEWLVINEVLYIYLAMTTKVINVVLVWKGIRE